ncbi:MAG: hypothetical protein HQRvContig01_43 [Haloquadratum phage sp.]|jgi:hypothetical protein|nr:MAG: hypothetical protein HQRvContig01_43 [Haloquadratum phage sp.]
MARTCSQYDKLWEPLTDFAFRDAFFCTFEAKLGGFGLAGLLFIAFPILAVYIRTQSLAYCAMLLLLIGGIVIPGMLAIGASLWGVLILMAGPVGVILLLWRINRN